MSLGQVSAQRAKTPQTHCLSAPMLSMLASPMATSSCVLSWLYCTTPTRDSPGSNCWKKQKPVRARYLQRSWRTQKSCWWFHTEHLHSRLCHLSSALFQTIGAPAEADARGGQFREPVSVLPATATQNAHCDKEKTERLIDQAST